MLGYMERAKVWIIACFGKATFGNEDAECRFAIFPIKNVTINYCAICPVCSNTT